MRHIIAALLALIVLALSISALAEGAPGPGGLLPEGEAAAIDLDGDGTEETVRWAMVPDDYDAHLELTVTPANGEALTYPADIHWMQSVRALDLDGDGAVELLLSGDVMSDDYYTWCLRYADGALVAVLFPDGDRGENTDGYYKCGYGLITAVDGNRLTLSGSQDMLGTWFATRAVTLTPAWRFEFDDDGLWRRDVSDPDDADLWGYAALTTKVELPYTGADGREAALPAGTRLLVTATDKQGTVYFTTRDGLAGTLAVSPDYERGWGCLVNGQGEADCFEYLPYAD